MFASLRTSRLWCGAVLCLFGSAMTARGGAESPAGGPRPEVPDWRQPASEDWYEGALLGNGDLGVVVFGAEEQVTLGVGKNDMWDRRWDFRFHKPLSYQRYFEMSKDWPVDPKTGRVIPQSEAFQKERAMRPVKPQPKPVCRLTIRVGRQDPVLALAPIEHDLSLERAELTTTSPRLRVTSRVQKDRSVIVLRIDNADDDVSVELFRPADGTDTGIGRPTHEIRDGFGLVIQDMPGDLVYPEGFRCAVAAAGADGVPPARQDNRLTWRARGPWTLMLAVVTTRDAPEPVQAAQALVAEAIRQGDEALRQEHRRAWKSFWDRSWMRLDDASLERLWYVHNYLLACAARPGAVAPGLFGPWIVLDRVAWNGGYTTDYNFEQTFAAALSCNRPELLEPYLETLERMLPAGRVCAHELFECDGIAFPHQMFPIDMLRQWHAYNVYVCETPWLVQHFWEYYLHMQDEDFLKNRAYPLIAGCADFLADYATPQPDGMYAFVPTASPEHHHVLHGLPFNRNGTPELGFARYAFRSAIQAASIVGEESQRVGLWRRVLAGMPDYPRSRNQMGEIFLDCEATPPERHFHKPVPVVPGQRPSKLRGNHGPWMTYNCPTSLLQIWPAGQIDMDSPPDELLTAMRTWFTAKFEGSNDTIIRHMVAARLGIPSLQAFKADIAPRLMLNGSITCMMNPLFGDDVEGSANMYRANGVYTETFAMPLVLNEMMLQSQNGVLRFFPTMDYYRKAEFHHLRARGGFLVSAAMDRGFLEWAEIQPTATGPCRARLPWPRHAVRVRENGTGQVVDLRFEGEDFAFEAVADRTYRLEPVLKEW